MHVKSGEEKRNEANALSCQTSFSPPSQFYWSGEGGNGKASIFLNFCNTTCIVILQRYHYMYCEMNAINSIIVVIILYSFRLDLMPQKFFEFI